MLDDISGIVVARVGPQSVLDALAKIARARWRCKPSTIATSAQAHGVRIAYSDPARLGVDRFLALIGAHALHAGPKLIVDAGTAVTYDLLLADGSHLGGLILPGIALMRDSVLAGTQIPRYEPAEADQSSAIPNLVCTGPLVDALRPISEQGPPYGNHVVVGWIRRVEPMPRHEDGGRTRRIHQHSHGIRPNLELLRRLKQLPASWIALRYCSARHDVAQRHEPSIEPCGVGGNLYPVAAAVRGESAIPSGFDFQGWPSTFGTDPVVRELLAWYVPIFPRAGSCCEVRFEA
jgi:hypothetical protein